MADAKQETGIQEFENGKFGCSKQGGFLDVPLVEIPAWVLMPR